ncbi:MAG: hypothetical protein HOO06_12240 [Bdellovibrionaceae bacterium]|nr:hypothetical protein [Pseudobdellovibrionaceae bacterium]
MEKRAWVSRFSLYFLLISSTFGLGNLWRFPYVVQDNNGAIFLFIYFVFLFILGTPLLISELIMGKIKNSGALKAYHEDAISKERALKSSSLMNVFFLSSLKYYGYFSFAICFLVLGYLSVVSGWVLYFLFFSTLSFFSPNAVNAETLLMTLHSQGWLQVLLAGVHLMVVSFLLRRSLQYKVKKWIGYLSPVLGGFLALLIYLSFSEFPLNEAYHFIFYPNFETFKLSSFAHAIGHIIFSLSIGIGVIVSFGSELKKEDYLPAFAFRVATLDGVYSILTALLIIPLVFVVSIKVSGPELVFKVVPLFFQRIQGGGFFAVIFFIFLYLAAVGGTMALFQTQIQNFSENFDMRKKKSIQAILFIGLLLSIIPALSSNFLDNYQVSGPNILEQLDRLLVNWLLPIGAIFGSQITRILLEKEVMEEEFLDVNFPSAYVLLGHWKFILKWGVPVVIIISLLLQAYELLL